MSLHVHLCLYRFGCARAYVSTWTCIRVPAHLCASLSLRNLCLCVRARASLRLPACFCTSRFEKAGNDDSSAHIRFLIGSQVTMYPSLISHALNTSRDVFRRKTSRYCSNMSWYILCDDSKLLVRYFDAQFNLVVEPSKETSSYFSLLILFVVFSAK